MTSVPHFRRAMAAPYLFFAGSSLAVRSTRAWHHVSAQTFDGPCKVPAPPPMGAAAVEM